MKYLEKIVSSLRKAIYVPIALAGIAYAQEPIQINNNFQINRNNIENTINSDGYTKIDSEILNKLKEKEHVPVVVQLYDEHFDKNKFNEYKAKIKSKEEEVLANLENFNPKHIYKTIPGFSGEVSMKELNMLNENPNVKYIHFDKSYSPILTESVPLINADDVQKTRLNDTMITGKGQVIAIIDSGIDYTHPDLGECIGEDCKVISGYNFVSNNEDSMDDLGHGTFVAGITSAKGKLIGVAPDAKLVSIKVCEYGNCPSSAIIAGADWCLNNNIGIINMSIGDGESHNSLNCPTWIDPIINRAYTLETPFIIASGNNGKKNGISYPACSLNTISVAAVYDAYLGPVTFCVDRQNSGECLERCNDQVTLSNKVTCFSNTSESLDLLAPGAEIMSTTLNQKYEGGAGTSAAAPHVAGTIALMKQANPNLIYDEILEILKVTGLPVTDSGNNLVFPRIDSLAAVACSLEGQRLEDRLLCPNKFIRADANGDKNLDISDPVKTLLHLYGGTELNCADAADANDDGALDISDPVYTLNFIFKEGNTMPAPYPKEGYDFSQDNLRCN